LHRRTIGSSAKPQSGLSPVGGVAGAEIVCG
jgi:hypothetical protein